MDLILNCKSSLDSLLDYFTCNLRPSGLQYHTIVDKTDTQWKLYVNSQWHNIFTTNMAPTNGMNGDICFYVRKRNCERYYTNDYTLYAVCNSISGVKCYTYYIFDNSKMIKDGET